MGRTYQTIGRANKTFDINFAGADILGYIMKAVDEHSKSYEAEQIKYYGMGGYRPCTRFEMNAEDCKRSAEKLSKLTDEQYKAIWEQCKDLLDPSSPEELKSFTQDWIAFLKDCKKGYEVL